MCVCVNASLAPSHVRSSHRSVTLLAKVSWQLSGCLRSKTRASISSPWFCSCPTMTSKKTCAWRRYVSTPTHVPLVLMVLPAGCSAESLGRASGPRARASVCHARNYFPLRGRGVSCAEGHCAEFGQRVHDCWASGHFGPSIARIFAPSKGQLTHTTRIDPMITLRMWRLCRTRYGGFARHVLKVCVQFQIPFLRRSEPALSFRFWSVFSPMFPNGCGVRRSSSWARFLQRYRKPVFPRRC
jgi:hypothetical protein